MRRIVANVFYNLGVMAIGIWLWAEFNNTIVPDWQSWSFQRQIHGATPTVGKYLAYRGREFGEQAAIWLRLRPPLSKPVVIGPVQPVALALNTVVGRLAIPRLGVETVVREGAGEGTLLASLGHIPGTALPGERGNVGVAGHRDTFFRRLAGIRNRDVLQFETTGGTFRYEVTGTQIVKPKDVGVLQPGSSPELTLVTCYPFGYIGDAPDRFIVKARQLTAADREPVPPPVTETTSARPLPLIDRPPVRPKEDVAPKPKPLKEANEYFLGRRTLKFTLVKGRTKILAPGILIGITDVDPFRQRATAWISVKSNSRTIWANNHHRGDPISFRNETNGERYQVTFTEVRDGSVVASALIPDHR